MNLDPQNERAELTPLNLIRIETALSRYPIHRLSKKGSTEIEIRTKDATFKWDVTYTTKYGQPNQLAYKLDTLIINRRIEEAERPLPTFIKLGSLHEVCRELGISGGKSRDRIKKALYQNASAFINAKIRIKCKDGSEYTDEIAGTRYTLRFTGEKLPNGREADAVYIILNDWYRDLLDKAQTRPLDYDYLKELPPGAQRLYELLSFQMYGAQKNDRPRAKLLYSEFCTYAPLTRYHTFEQVKKQMHKLHAPHKKSGYIMQVHFQEIDTSDGLLDWEMFYTPGLKAKHEHKAAGEKRPRVKRPKQLEIPLSSTTDETPPPSAEKKPTPQTPAAPALAENEDQLVKKLLEHGMHFDKVAELVGSDPDEVMRQLLYFPHQPNVKHPARFLVTAITKKYPPPDDYLLFQERGRIRRENDERLRQKKAEEAQAKETTELEAATRRAYFDYLRALAGEREKNEPERYLAFREDERAKRAEVEKEHATKGRQVVRIMLEKIFDDRSAHLERFRDFFEEPTFEEWQDRQPQRPN
jgi:hypothetical protein